MVGIYVMFSNQNHSQLNQGIDTIQFQIKANLELLINELVKSEITIKVNQKILVKSKILASLNLIKPNLKNQNEIKIIYNEITIGKIFYKTVSNEIYNKLFKSRNIIVELYGLNQAYTISSSYMKSIYKIISQGKYKPTITKIDYAIDNHKGYDKTIVLNNDNLNISNNDITTITKFQVHSIYIPYAHSHSKKITNKRLINSIIKKYNLNYEVSKKANYIQWASKTYHFIKCDYEDTQRKNKNKNRVSYYQKIVIKDPDTYYGILKLIKKENKNIVYDSYCNYEDIVIKIKSRDTEIYNYDKRKEDQKQDKLKFYEDTNIQINRLEISQKLKVRLYRDPISIISDKLIKELSKLKILVFSSPLKKKLYERDYKKGKKMVAYKEQELLIDTEQIVKDIDNLDLLIIMGVNP